MQTFHYVAYYIPSKALFFRSLRADTRYEFLSKLDQYNQTAMGADDGPNWIYYSV